MTTDLGSPDFALELANYRQASSRSLFATLATIWRGETPLAQTYWLYWLVGNGVAYAALMSVAIVGLSASWRHESLSMAFGSLLLVLGGLLIFGFIPAYATLTSLGVLRSASRYLEAQKRPWFWVVAARLAQLHALTGFIFAVLPILALCALMMQPPMPNVVP